MSNRRPLIASGTLLGIGLGGFVDGILFHQILQLHSMLSNWVPRTTLANVEINMFWDGLFHAFTWMTTVIGLAMLWRTIKRPDVPLSGRTLVASLFLGWGVFNFIEGLIDHELLQIHHVFQNGDHLLWDMVFLSSGVLLVLIAGTVIRTDRVSLE